MLEANMQRENDDPFAVARVAGLIFHRLGPIRSQCEGQLVIEDPQSRTLSMGRSHASTATKSRTVYLNDGTYVLHSAI